MALPEAVRSPEALAAAAELDVELNGNPALVAVITDLLRPESLPPGWEARFDPIKRCREYKNAETGEVQYNHPLVSYYRGAVFMETGGTRQLQSNELQQPPAAQEVLDMSAYLGVERGEDPYVMDVARMAISAPLPPHWEEGEDEEGNPLFTNRQTGESQPSHPLDPYFLELITRRRKELSIRADGVGVRSALAAKRLHAIGVPGITVPPELQEAEADNGAEGGVIDLDEEREDESQMQAAGFGPLNTIEEAEEEGRDEEDEEGTSRSRRSQQQQQQQQGQQGRSAVQGDAATETTKTTAAAAAATSAADDDMLRLESFNSRGESRGKASQEGDEEREMLRLQSQQLRAQQEEEREAREREEAKEEERREAEEQERREAEAQERREAEEEERREAEEEEREQRERERRKREEVEEEEEAEEEEGAEEEEEVEQQQQQRGREREEEAARREQELQEEEDDEERQRQAAKKAKEAERRRWQQQLMGSGEFDAPGESDGEDKEEEEQEEAAGGAWKVQGRQAGKPDDVAAAAAAAEEEEVEAREEEREERGEQDRERERDDDEEEEERRKGGREPGDSDQEQEEQQPAARSADIRRASSNGSEMPLPTLSAGIADLKALRRTASMESGVSATAEAMPPPGPDDDAPAPAAAEEAGLTLAPAGGTSSSYDDDGKVRLVLGRQEDEDGAAAAASAEATKEQEEGEQEAEEGGRGVRSKGKGKGGRGKGKAKAKPAEDAEDEYDDDFEDYDEDFNSYSGSRAGSRPGTSSRPATARSDGGDGAADATAPPVKLAAPVTPEKRFPSRTSTPPLVTGADGRAFSRDERRRASVSSLSGGRYPSPPAQPHPNDVAPRRSPGGSRGSYRSDSGVDGTSAAAAATAVTAGMSRSGDGFMTPLRSRQGSSRTAAAARLEQELEEDEEAAAAAGKQGTVYGGEDVYDSYADDSGDKVMGKAAAASKASTLPPGKLAAAVATFDAKHPPLPFHKAKGVEVEEESELRRSRSCTEVELGTLQRQLSLMEVARNATSNGAEADAAAAAAAAALLTGWGSASARNLNAAAGRSDGGAATPPMKLGSAAARSGYLSDGSPEKPGASRQSARSPARERIRVAVRARPVPRSGEAEAWMVDAEARTVRLRDGLLTKPHPGADRTYSFDLVMGPDSTTRELWATHVVPLMDASLSGVNTTVFAYGQTGSGKTFTMFGSDGRYDDGAIGMSLTYLFKALQTLTKIKSGSEEYVIKLSMLELYNEHLRDLLAPGGGPFDRMGRPTGPPLALQDDMRTGVKVSGLQEQVVEDMPFAMTLVQRGAASRSVGSTAMNEVSSRSHTIVRLAVETKDASTHELMHTSLISFVDLAGSERLAKTGSTGARFVEGTNINISLLMLGTVVSKLAEGRVGEFIPYRNSKLTRLLQPCLGGNSKTAIIATINPSCDQIEESLNTLNFAARAMDVINHVSINSYIKGSGAVGGAISGAAAAALQKQVASLKAELAALRRGEGLHSGTTPDGFMASAGGGGGPGARELAQRVALLEQDKARLLDRLEVLTGKPQGDVYDDVPPTPPDLNLPVSRPMGRSSSIPSFNGNGSGQAGGGGGGGSSAAEAALRSIARIAFMGRGSVDADGRPLLRQAEQMPPEDVVQAVREMRAERDELRRRDAALRSSLQQAHERVGSLEPMGQLQDQVKDVITMLEDILGPSPLADYQKAPTDPHKTAANQALRLAENVQAVGLMQSEMASLQRQLATSEALAAAATRRADAAETALQRTAVAAARDSSDGSARLKAATESLNSQLSAIRSELETTKAELARWRGLAAVAPEVGGRGADGEAMAAVDDGADGSAARRLLNPVSFNVGSFAIKKAREALAQVSALEARCSAAEAERDELRDRLQALEEEAAVGVPAGRGLLPPMNVQASAAAGLLPPRPGSAGGEGASDPLSASLGGPAGQQRFEQLKTHVGSLSREVAALTRERDSLLAMVLKMQAPGNAGVANLGNLAQAGGAGAGGGNLLAPGYLGMGPLGGAGGFASVPMPQGMGALGGMGAALGMTPWEMESLMMPVPMRQGGSPVKLKPVRGGRMPHQSHHHHRHGGGGGGGPSYDNGEERPDFSTRDVPLEDKHRIARMRDRAARLDAPPSPPPGLGPVGLEVVGYGSPPRLQEPVLYGHRDAEMYALKHKLVMAEKARSEAVARTQAEMRNLQKYGDYRDHMAAQMALVAANRDYKEQARSHAAEMRQVEVAHEENLAAARAEAAAMVKTLMDENARLKMVLATTGPPSPGANGAAGMDFPLRALGGFGGGAAGLSPLDLLGGGGGGGPGRGARVSPLRSNSNASPGRGGGSLALPLLQPPNVPRGGGARSVNRQR